MRVNCRSRWIGFINRQRKEMVTTDWSWAQCAGLWAGATGRRLHDDFRSVFLRPRFGGVFVVRRPMGGRPVVICHPAAVPARRKATPTGASGDNRGGEQPHTRQNASLKRLIVPKPESMAASSIFWSVVAGTLIGQRMGGFHACLIFGLLDDGLVLPEASTSWRRAIKGTVTPIALDKAGNKSSR
jgi:hypothetical protein